MKTGKITAKLRDMVPVCFMVNGEERKRYANIEIPDEVKELDMLDFHFNTHMDGKITFEIHLDESVLPSPWPAPRARKTRAKAKAETPAQPEIMELAYNVTGEQRKDLLTAVSAYVNADPVYQGAPTFSYAVGGYIIDKAGTLSGPADLALAAALSKKGFTAA